MYQQNPNFERLYACVRTYVRQLSYLCISAPLHVGRKAYCPDCRPRKGVWLSIPMYDSQVPLAYVGLRSLIACVGSYEHIGKKSDSYGYMPRSWRSTVDGYPCCNER